MKQYTGTKIINAKPMNRKDYNDLRGWEVPADENPNDDGYLVEYMDGGKPNHSDFKGYISWSPKDVFERAYKPSTTPVDRMQIEYDELGNKLIKLGEFIERGKPTFLNDKEWELLNKQREYMANYANVLLKRMEIALEKLEKQ